MNQEVKGTKGENFPYLSFLMVNNYYPNIFVFALSFVHLVDSSLIKDHFPEYWINPDIDSYDVQIIAVDDDKFTLSEPFPFFIEGGGQPDDKVTMFLSDSSNPLSIFKIISTHEFTIKKPKSFSIKPPFSATLKIDLDFRHAVMRAHTCQHLLSALILKEFSLKTTKAVMKDDEGQLFLEKPFPVTSVTAISQRMINFISENPVPVTSHVLEAGSTVDQEGNEIDLSKIRGSVPKEAPFIRVLSIGSGVDLNTCGGTHISSTDQILSFIITSIKKNEIHFICGLKGLSFIASHNEVLLKASQAVNQPFESSLPFLLNQYTLLAKQQIEHSAFSTNLLKTFFASLYQKMETLVSQNSTAVLSSGQFKDTYAWNMWVESGTVILFMECPVDKKIASEAGKFFSDVSQPIISFVLVSNDTLVINVNHPENTPFNARVLADTFKKTFSNSKGGGNEYFSQLLLKGLANPFAIIEEHIKGLFH